MSGPRVLFVCHNHPAFHPGGTEIFAYDLFREIDTSDRAESMLLACANAIHRGQRPGTNFQTIGRTPNELVLWTGHFDRFFLSQIDLHGIVPEFADLLRTFRPDIVHFHHVLMVGIELLFLVRRVLPKAGIVVTLHDYYPICPNDGQMVKAGSHELCKEASPDACHKCFPEQQPDQFVLRRKHIQTLFSVVDQFIAPSRFLKARYVAWGLPAERIDVVANGRPRVDPAPPRLLDPGQRRNAFGYFGNLSPYKGVLVALQAAGHLRAVGEDDFTMAVNGGAPFQSDAFRAAFDAGVRENAPNVVHNGPYSQGDIARLMTEVDWVIVPSIWWENAPLVVQEAAQHRRPVICSDIGGMAESVQDNINGLHFRVANARDLARVMRRAMTEDGLWERLAAASPRVPTLRDCARQHLRVYSRLRHKELSAA